MALENAGGQTEKVSNSNALHDLLDDSLIYIRYDGSLWDKTQYLASLKEHWFSRRSSDQREHDCARLQRHRARDWNLSNQRSWKGEAILAARALH